MWGGGGLVLDSARLSGRLTGDQRLLPFGSAPGGGGEEGEVVRACAEMR